MNKLVKCKTCGADIAKSAKVCPRCGAKQKNHKVIGTILVILGIILFANGISDFDTSSDAKNQLSQKDNNSYVSSDAPMETTVDEQEDQQNKSTISKDEFNSISTGMTYDEVVEIIGSEGEVMSAVDLGMGEEFKTIMYFWEGEGSLGANANVTFQGGKVTAKAQIGLK